MLAHKGSRLPVKVSLPVDFQNTVFLAHYDVTEEESLYGIAPLSNIASLRRFEGRFGGAIAVEEASENLLETVGGGASQDWSKWSHWNNSTYWGKTEQYDDPIWGKVFKGTKNGASQTSTYIYDYYPYSYSIGDILSFSCWMKVNKTMSKSISFYVNSSAGGQHNVATSDTKTYNFIEGEWQYLTFTSGPVTETVSGTGGFGLSMGSGWEDCIIEFAYPMFEKKIFSTSFVQGVRQAGSLYYPIPTSRCRTVSGWWKMNYLTNGWQRIVGMYRQTGVYPHWYFAYVTGTNGGLMFRVRDGIKSDSTNYISVDRTELNTADGNWHFFALVFDDANNKIFLYIDDKIRKELSYSAVPTDFTVQSRFDVGYGSNSNSEQLNGLIDELRVDTVARSAEEILEWYYSQAPFYPRGVHKIYA